MGFLFDIIYRSTHKHGNADALPRLPLKREDLQEASATDVFIVQQFQDTSLNVDDISRETEKSVQLQPLLKALKGPGYNQSSTRFFGIDIVEFSILEKSVVLRGHRVVIPERCRPTILAELRDGHYGVRKMKALARQHVWWSALGP